MVTGVLHNEQPGDLEAGEVDVTLEEIFTFWFCDDSLCAEKSGRLILKWG
jgi:hypothetical protein